MNPRDRDAERDRDRETVAVRGGHRSAVRKRQRETVRRDSATGEMAEVAQQGTVTVAE